MMDSFSDFHPTTSLFSHRSPSISTQRKDYSVGFSRAEESGGGGGRTKGRAASKCGMLLLLLRGWGRRGAHK